ncbi:MAG: lytic transglycosylase domain-containing protein [Xanthobacteraceae bacterium]|nr:lytic transglycosylase domain-containing protein [Xanthobacteraceae bacterium]
MGFRAILLGLALTALAQPAAAQDRAALDLLVASHAAANRVPEALVHRVILRESRYNPRAVGRGGTMGLMQIKLATARGVGYAGDAEGLLDANTNLTYGVRYLAGAWRAADGHADRAVAYYASGYYAQAKRKRLIPGKPLDLASSASRPATLGTRKATD